MLGSNLSAVQGLRGDGRTALRPPPAFARVIALENQSGKPSPKLCFGGIEPEPFAH